MDHLPPCDEDKIIKVPFLAAKRIYNVDDFYSLPKLFGCNVPELVKNGPVALVKNDPIPLETLDAACFLQQWLFFALLAQVIDQEVYSETFFQDSYGEPILHTTELKRILGDAAKAAQNAKSAEQDQDATKIVRARLALEDSRNFVMTWLSDEQSKTTRADTEEAKKAEKVAKEFRAVYPELCLSFAILGETLDRYRTRHLPSATPDDDPILQRWTDVLSAQRAWGHNNLLKVRMKDNGWCPHEIQRLSMTTADISSMYYISSFNPVRKEEHSTCSPDVCLNNTDVAEARHTYDCPHSGTNQPGISPDSERLEDIVRRDKTPLLHYSMSEELVLSEYSDGSSLPYVAISHAWKDGLVPMGGTGLPRCQFLRLRNVLSKDKTIKDLPFWIDSLCIPENTELKNRAIQRMNKVYQQAYTVLVLDLNLQSTSCQDEDLVATVRITTGNWVKRMWTLPEGIEAKSLHFDCGRGGGLLSIRDLQRRYEAAKSDPMHPEHHVYKAGWLFNPYMFSMRESSIIGKFNPVKGRAQNQRVAHIYQSLQYSQTSRPEDETLCLARLLELDPLPLLLINEATGCADIASARMVTLLTMIDEQIGIPPSLIFTPCPKVDKKGFGWAPKTWMMRQSKRFSDPLFVRDQKLSFLTRQGLHVQYPGFRLFPGKTPVASVFWIPVDQNLSHWYRVEYIPCEPHRRTWEEVWAIASSKDALYPAIIRSQFEESREREIALLVHVKSKRIEQEPGEYSSPSEILWVRSICRVWVQWETNHNTAAKLTADFQENVNEMYSQTIEPRQRWVVDRYLGG
jgi:hypothetical protein